MIFVLSQLGASSLEMYLDVEKRSGQKKQNKYVAQPFIAWESLSVTRIRFSS